MQDISNANAGTAQVVAASIYEKLTHPFDTTFSDPRGFTYITGEQVVSRLNDVFGPFGWSFEVVQQVHESDEIVVQGRMRVFDQGSGNWIMREQFGSQKINRRRDTGAPVELGFDYKGATTDCLKKCASLFGVGLYLMAKEETTTSTRDQREATTPRRAPGTATSSKPATAQAPASKPSDELKTFECAECGAELRKVEFKGGDVWEPYELANKGLQNFKRILCMTHYRAANDSAKATQAS